MPSLRILPLLGALGAALLTGCDTGPAQPSSSLRSSGTHQIYGGVLPCDACRGIKTELSLNFNTDSAGGIYTLTETWLGGARDGETRKREGDWKVLSGNDVPGGNTVYVLHPPRTEDYALRYFRMVDSSTLHQVGEDLRLPEDPDATRLERR